MSSEDLLNVLGITASISLGVLLIGLGAFAIWLRKRFVDERPSVSLDAMQELVRKQLTDTEQHIRKVIEDAIRTVPTPPDFQGLEQAVTAIRDDLQRLTDAVAVRVAVPVELPEKIATTFHEWRDLPAHFLILRAILREGATSWDMLRQVADRYSIPEPFDGGVENLLKKGVLEGTLADFRVPSDLRHLLLAWMTTNEPVLLAVAAHFSSAPSKDKADREVQKALQEVRSALGRSLRI